MSEEPRGTALRVYWFVLKSGRPVRVAEIQRELHLSSPSLAQYHLKKLMDMGLVKEDQQGYAVARVLLKNFFKLRNVILPFQVFYVFFFSGSLALLILLLLDHYQTITSFDFVALVVNALALGVAIFETRRTIHSMP